MKYDLVIIGGGSALAKIMGDDYIFCNSNINVFIVGLGTDSFYSHEFAEIVNNFKTRIKNMGFRTMDKISPSNTIWYCNTQSVFVNVILPHIDEHKITRDIVYGMTIDFKLTPFKSLN